MNMRARLVVPLCVAAAVTFSLAQTVNLPTSKRLLKPLPGSLERLNSLPMTAAWSPDGRTLAFTRSAADPGLSEIQLLDRSTGEERPLTQLGGQNFAPAFSPSGDRVLPGSLVASVVFDGRDAPISRWCGGLSALKRMPGRH